MVWYEIAIAAFGAIGGFAGLAAFIKSFLTLSEDKENKVLKNEHLELENLKGFIDIANNNYDRLDKQFHEYKEEVNSRIAFFKKKFEKLEQEKEMLDAATLQANRCVYPPTVDDCPVIKYLKTSQCEGCKHNV